MKLNKVIMVDNYFTIWNYENKLYEVHINVPITKYTGQPYTIYQCKSLEKAKAFLNKVKNNEWIR